MTQYSFSRRFYRCYLVPISTLMMMLTSLQVQNEKPMKREVQHENPFRLITRWKKKNPNQFLQEGKQIKVFKPKRPTKTAFTSALTTENVGVSFSMNNNEAKLTVTPASSTTTEKSALTFSGNSRTQTRLYRRFNDRQVWLLFFFKLKEKRNLRFSHRQTGLKFFSDHRWSKNSWLHLLLPLPQKNYKQLGSFLLKIFPIHPLLRRSFHLFLS